MTVAIQNKSWHQEIWFWVVVAPLIVAIIGSFIGLYIAIDGADDRVKDDYYTEGKMINHRFAADKVAQVLGVKAQLQFDMRSGEVLIDLAGLAYFPPKLDLVLSHPLRAQQDQTLVLKLVDASRYRADFSQLLVTRWYLQLSPSEAAEQDKWRLMGEIDLRQSATVALASQAL